jgi:hypothetical protein
MLLHFPKKTALLDLLVEALQRRIQRLTLVNTHVNQLVKTS